MIQIMKLNGTDKQLYKLVAPLVMDPEVLKMNNNYPFKTTDMYEQRQEWYDIFRPELDCVCRYRPLQPLILTDFRTYLCRLCR